MSLGFVKVLRFLSCAFCFFLIFPSLMVGSCPNFKATNISLGTSGTMSWVQVWQPRQLWRSSSCFPLFNFHFAFGVFTKGVTPDPELNRRVPHVVDPRCYKARLAGSETAGGESRPWMSPSPMPTPFWLYPQALRLFSFTAPIVPHPWGAPCPRPFPTTRVLSMRILGSIFSGLWSFLLLVQFGKHLVPILCLA